MHQGIAVVLYRGKVTGLVGFSGISDGVRPTVMLTGRRTYYVIYADGTYQSLNHCAARSSVGALEKLLFSEM